MNPWIVRIIIIILAVAFLPLIISGTASFVSGGIHSASEGIHSLLRPLSTSGDQKLEAVIRLCLYLVALTLLARVIFGRKGGGD